MGCQQSISDITPFQNTINRKVEKVKKNIEIVPKINKNSRIELKPIIMKEFFTNMIQIQKQIIGKDVLQIYEILKQHFLFFHLKETEIIQIIMSMKMYQIKAGSFVFKEGDSPQHFFIIKSGSVDLIINQKSRKILKQKDYFGELAFLYQTRRSASVQARQECTFWTLSKQTFKKHLKQMTLKNYDISKKYLEKFGKFSYLSATQIELLAQNMNMIKFQQNYQIFNEGDQANSIFIIVSGSIQLTIEGKPNLYLKPGQFFGEGCLYDNNRLRRGSAKAHSQSICLTISRIKLKKFLKGQLNNILHFCLAKWSLKRMERFKNYQESILQKLVNTGEIKHLKDNQNIFKDCESKKQLIIPLQGKINCQDVGSVLNYDNFMSEISEGNCQNNVSAFQFKNQIQCQKFIKKQQGHVFYLPFQKIEPIIGKKRFSNIYSITTNDTYQILQNSRNSIQNVQKQQNIKLKHLFVLQYWKKQSKSTNIFVLVEKKQRNQLNNASILKISTPKSRFVLKCIQKRNIIQKQLQNRYIKERQILLNNNSCFISHLVKTFHDQHFIYFLFKYYQNGDFFKLLREVKFWNKQKVQFYTGCLLLALKKVHEKNIIFRNLKPQNILVDQKGYLVLYDFSKAKILTQKSGYRTFTLIGTPHYMAPEVIQGKGYSFSVDLWSLGIISYQILFGEVPFGAQSQDPYAIFKSIVCDQLLFSKRLPNYGMKSLIQILLQKDDQRRQLIQFDALQNKNFYNGFDWNSLEQQKIEAPYIKKTDQKEAKFVQDVPLLKYLQNQKKMLQRPSKSRKDSLWDEVF